jgi:ribosomal protein S18 acetylase RimI-like enzyme
MEPKYLFVTKPRQEIPGVISQLHKLYFQLSSKYRPQSREEFFRIANSSSLLLALKGKVLVGTGTMGMLFHAMGRTAYIHDVVVDSLHRREGISREIMRLLIEEARNMRAKEINLSSNPDNPDRAGAIRLYEELGFELRKGARVLILR